MVKPEPGKVVEFNNHKRTVDHDICNNCSHAGKSCPDNAEVCLPLEMWVQFSLEQSILSKLQIADNVASRLDLKNSFKADD